MSLKPAIHKRSLILRLMVAALLLSVACAPVSPATSATTQVAGGTVVVRLAGDWGLPIDGGQTVTSAPGGMLASAMYDRLVSFTQKGELQPYLATSWTSTPNSVTFKLRTDATCADGTPINATVVYNSFARLIAPETKSRWPVTIFGAGPYKIAKDDAAQTFTFTTPSPLPTLAHQFSRDWNGIICPKGLEASADFTKQSYGSGAYIFESAVQGDQYVMKKRDGWNWGPGGRKSSQSGSPDKLIFKVVTNETTAGNLLLTGGLDIAAVTGADSKRLNADGSMKVNNAQSYAPYTLQMNFAPGRQAAVDDAFRKAAFTALDAKLWNQAALEGQGIVSTNIQSNPGGYCYTDLTSIMPVPSVDAARKVLLDAGYTAGSNGKLSKGGKELTIQVTGSTFTGAGVEYIANTLDKVGYKVNLLSTDYNTFAQNFAKTDYDIIVGLFGATSPIPGTSQNFMVGQFPPAGNNRLNRVDPVLADLVLKANSEPGGAAACAAWKTLNTYLITNFIVFPWVAPLTPWFSKTETFDYFTFGATLDATSIRRLK